MMRALDFVTEPLKVIHNVPIPEPLEGELLVKLECSALDTGTPEVVTRSPLANYIRDMNQRPLLNGWHFSGTVVKTGPRPNDNNDAVLLPGKQVFGFLAYAPTTKQGTLAEYITIPESQCGLKPSDDDMDWSQAAAATTEPLTALQALRDDGKLKAGDHVLIMGGAGAVGSAAVQLALLLGASTPVVVTCRTKDVQRIRSFYGEQVVVVDRTKENFKEDNAVLLNGMKSFDLIFDASGRNDPDDDWLSYLAHDGRYVSTLPTSSTSEAVHIVDAKSNKNDLEFVADCIVSGKMMVEVDSVVKVTDIDKAVKKQMERTNVGRLVIDVSENAWE